MNSLTTHVQSIFQEAYNQEFVGTNATVQIEYCDIKFGHFTSNIGLVSAKNLKMSPMAIADKLVTSLSNHPSIASLEVVKPGFINVRLSDDIILENLKTTLQDLPAYIGKMGDGKKMIIDYSHPNIGKPMGVHHLLSTIIGDSIKRLYKQVGYNVVADNFVGDMGTQFGKLIHAIKTWGDLGAIEENPIPELLKLYVKFHILADSDDTLDDAGRHEYKLLEEGDPQSRALLKKIQDWSMAGMLDIYKKLDVEFDYFHGESFYEDKLESIINLGKQKKIFQASQGALICPLDNPDEPPALIQKSDGTSLYLTRDLARVQYWQENWQPDLMVNVVDIAQTLQLKQVYEVAHKLDLTKAQNVHVAFGRMSFKDLSMSTRKGNIVLVEDFLELVKSKVKSQIVSLSKDLSENDQVELTELLTINVIKYTILHQNRLSNITFDWDSALALEGDSAPYLAYSAVRMLSVKNKAALAERVDESASQSQELDKNEVELILEISKIDQVFEKAVLNYQPSEVAHYCYKLCRLYNSFYHTHQVITDNKVLTNRLAINNLVYSATKLCFEIMGLKIPQKM